MNASLLAVLNDAERLLVAETERTALAAAGRGRRTSKPL